jgi:outer membrane receptor for ferrienterochelin and colicins
VTDSLKGPKSYKCEVRVCYKCLLNLHMKLHYHSEPIYFSPRLNNYISMNYRAGSRHQAYFVYIILTATLLGASPEPLSAQDEEIEEIVVTSTRSRRSFEALPTRVEVLGGEEINEKANMKPGDIRMLLNESTGIHVQQTSATSFNSSIRIQGLEGKYTQLLRDGLPLYSGFSGGLSLLQIAPLDLRQVEVIKGANSTLYGGGAIAGLVNLVTRVPTDEPELSLLVNGTSADGMDTSAFYSARSGDLGTTVFASYNMSDGYDPADIGFSAIPKFERWTVNPKLFVYDEDSELSLGISAIKEDRLGGDMQYIAGDRSQAAYFEDSATLRLSTQLAYSRLYESGNELVLRNSVSRFRRDLLVPEFEFSGTQLSSFSELHLLGTTGSLDWVAGLNLWTEGFDQGTAAAPMKIDYDQRTIGAFAQGTRTLSENWTLEAGFRVDHDADYGEFILPRISLLYTGMQNTALRLGGGLGYKLPTPFSEEAERLQFQGVRPLQIDSLEAERSAGVNADLNHSLQFSGSLSLDLNLLLFYTRVNDPLNLVEVGADEYVYRQPVPYIDTRGMEMNAVWRWNSFKFFLGYTHADALEHQDNAKVEALLIPKDRVNLVYVYEREDDIRIGLEAYYYGQQALQSGAKSPDYWVFGLMTEKIVNDDFSFFLNFENFGDTRQTRDGEIFTGTQNNPEFMDIYAPLDGFVVNGGVKIRF